MLAPEQKLVTANELTSRLNWVNGTRWNHGAQQNNLVQMNAAGCNPSAVVSALAASPRAYLDLLSERYFRGAMPPTLRSNITELIAQFWNSKDNEETSMRFLDFALSSPYYGVIK